MKLTKYGLALCVAAPFSLTACGGDSSSSASGSGNVKAECKVFKEGKTVGYNATLEDGTTQKMTITKNSDGTATFQTEAEFGDDYSKSEITEKCNELKKEMEDEGAKIEVFECKNGKMNLKYRLEMDIPQEYLVTLPKNICEGLQEASSSSNAKDNKSSSSKGSKNSSDSKSDEPESHDGEYYFENDSKNCKFKESDKVWKLMDYKYEWINDTSYFEYDYNLSSMYGITTNERCESMLLAFSTAIDEDAGEEGFCEGSRLVVKSLRETDSRESSYEKAMEVYCEKDPYEDEDEDNDDNVSSSSEEEIKSSSSKGNKNSSSSKDIETDGPIVTELPKCTEDNEGEKATILGMEMVCTNGEWDIPGLSDLTQPCKDGETKQQSIMGITMDMVCIDGEWEEAKCEDGDTKQQSILGMTMDMICVDGEWEEAKCEDGDTKTESIMGMTMDMVCVDGEWEDAKCEDGDTKTENIMGISIEMVCIDGEWDTKD